MLWYSFRLLTSFRQEMERQIDGFGKMVNTKELNGGAKINRIFHVRFPFELVKVGHNKLTQILTMSFALALFQLCNIGYK